MVNTQRYERKSFLVDALQVTRDNMQEVAEWCKGEIHETDKPSGRDERFIKVNVQRPMNERQTKAFVGDWILYAVSGFKIYPDKAFHQSFDLIQSV